MWKIVALTPGAGQWKRACFNAYFTWWISYFIFTGCDAHWKLWNCKRDSSNCNLKIFFLEELTPWLYPLPNFHPHVHDCVKYRLQTIFYLSRQCNLDALQKSDITICIVRFQKVSFQNVHFFQNVPLAFQKFILPWPSHVWAMKLMHLWLWTACFACLQLSALKTFQSSVLQWIE